MNVNTALGDKSGKREHAYTRHRVRTLMSFPSVFFLFFGHTSTTQKYPGQGSIPCHSSDNARSLTWAPQGNSLLQCFLKACCPYRNYTVCTVRSFSQLQLLPMWSYLHCRFNGAFVPPLICARLPHLACLGYVAVPFPSDEPLPHSSFQVRAQPASTRVWLRVQMHVLSWAPVGCPSGSPCSTEGGGQGSTGGFCWSPRAPLLCPDGLCRPPSCRVRGSKQRNTLQCARYVYQTEGIRGFYRGLTASYAGISETIICFAIYESLKKYLKEAPLAASTNGTEKNSTNFFGLMAAAALSKGCASCVAYPHGRFCFALRRSKTADTLCRCV